HQRPRPGGGGRGRVRRQDVRVHRRARVLQPRGGRGAREGPGGQGVGLREREDRLPRRGRGWRLEADEGAAARGDRGRRGRLPRDAAAGRGRAQGAGDMSNAEIARHLERLADLSEIDGDNPFRVRAYRNAAAVIAERDESVADLVAQGFDLTQLKGIGKEIAEKVKTLVQTGVMPQLAALEERVPVGLLEVVKVKGVGPKQAAALWKALGVTNVDELEAAAKAGRITGLPGFGPKKVENILRGIESYRRNTGRVLLGHVDAVLEPLLERLR